MDKRKCKQCGEEFTLTDSEMKFYNEKGLNLPKRCSECRKKNNNINNNEKESIKETNIQRINSKNKSKWREQEDACMFKMLTFSKITKCIKKHQQHS